jgi:hypothetical protein
MNEFMLHFFYCIFVLYYVIGLFYKYWWMLSRAVLHRTTALNHFSQKLYDTIKIVCLQWWPNYTKERVVSAIFWFKLLGCEWVRMWYNCIHVYLYLEVINYSFSPIFWAPANQFSHSTLQKQTSFVLSGSISLLHIIPWGEIEFNGVV